MTLQSLIVFICFISSSASTNSNPKLSIGEYGLNVDRVSSDIGQIANYFKECRLQIVLSHPDVEITSIERPFILTVPKTADLSTYDTVEKYHNFRTREPVRILRQGRCTATIYVILDAEFYPESMSTTEYCQPLEVHLERQLGRVVVGHQHITVLGSPGEYSRLYHYRRPLSYCSNDLYGASTTYFLIYERIKTPSNRALWKATNSMFFCRYCSPSKDSAYAKLRFKECSSGVDCLSKAENRRDILTEMGKWILWEWYTLETLKVYRYFAAIKSDEPKAGAWKWRREGGIVLTVDKVALHSYLMAGLNRSAVAFVAETKSAVLVKRPTIRWSEEKMIYTTGTDVASGYADIFSIPTLTVRPKQQSLRFITSDATKIKYTAEFVVYTEPFEASLWASMLILFSILVIFMALVARALKVADFHVVFSSVAAFLFRELVDQNIPAEDLPPIRREGSFKRFATIILTCMTLLCFMLTNLYKAVLNANYITVTDYQTGWNRLEQLENFTLYTTMDTRSWDRYRTLRNRGHSHLGVMQDICARSVGNFGAACKLSSTWFNMLVSGESGAECSTLMLHLAFKNDSIGFYKSKGHTCTDNYVLRIHKLIAQTQLLSESEIPRLIREELTRPSTAFLSTDEDFDHIWTYFDMTMKTNSSTKFAHNFYSPSDPTLGIARHSVLISSSMPRKYTHVVTSRAQTLLSSGVWNQWIHLDEFSRSFNKSIPEDPPMFEFEPLSLDKTLVHLVFIIHAVMLLTSAGIMSIEFIFRNRVIQISIMSVTTDESEDDQ